MPDQTYGRRNLEIVISFDVRISGEFKFVSEGRINMNLIKSYLNRSSRTSPVNALPGKRQRASLVEPRHSIALLLAIALIVSIATHISAQNGNANSNANTNRNGRANSNGDNNRNTNTNTNANTGAARGSANAKIPCPEPGVNEPVVEEAYKEVIEEDGKNREVGSSAAPEGVKKVKDVELGDVIVVKVTNLATLIDRAECPTPKKQIVLYLDDRPLKDITAYPPTNPKDQILKFQLKRTENSRNVWTYILGSVRWEPRPTKVSVGLEDQYAIPSDQILKLKVIPIGWFMFWAVLFVLLLIGFWLLAFKSDLLRDPTPTPGGSERRPYSLARSQAAWWFFLVLASYLFIGIITGDFSTTITTTVLGLLGISAGTVVGSAFVDASKSNPADTQTQAKAATDIQSRLAPIDTDIARLRSERDTAQSEVTRIKAEIETLEADLKANPDDAAKQNQLSAKRTELSGAQLDLANKERELASKQAEKEEKLSQLKKLSNQSENFLLDILSDASGVSFHRFQIAAWTLVLGIIFAFQVYKVLAMPDFNSSLLALLGISAGTYIGLKIPESTTPK
jgi:hypothetical protein